MFKADCEYAPKLQKIASNNTDDAALLRLGNKFGRIDRKRRRGRLPEADDTALTGQWWKIVGQVSTMRATTIAGQRVIALVLVALIRDCGDPAGAMERCAMALVQSLTG